mgnify:CR=1 FL=1
MLTPLSWLKDYVDIDVTPKELEEKLFSCGFEVEESYEVGKDISNVVVGLVEKCEPIPETHLSLCQVNAGAHGTFQICCGADNVKAGGKYPLALIGATVYATAKDHVTIEGVMEIKQGISLLLFSESPDSYNNPYVPEWTFLPISGVLLLSVPDDSYPQ